jgi:hypothetical protein
MEILELRTRHLRRRMNYATIRGIVTAPPRTLSVPAEKPRFPAAASRWQ